MRRFSTFTAAALLLICGSAFLSRAATAADVNLLVNGGAEDAQNEAPAGWERAWIPAPGLSLARDTSQAKSGKASFVIENRHDYAEPVANNWRQDLATVPDVGANLQISGWMKTSGVEDAANVCLQCWDEGSVNMLAFGSTEMLKGDHDWTEVHSSRIRVPRGTNVVTVRAAMRGKGKVWFDDIVVKRMPAENTSVAPGTPVAPTSRVSADSLDPELLRRVDGKVVDVIPIDRDQMVLAYLPDWAHGRVDNIAVANNDGGVRTLLAWPDVNSTRSERRFLLALYARQAVHKGKAGEIGAYEVLDDWDEQTSWKRQPRTAQKPSAKFAFDDAKGWRVFDITAVAAIPLREHRPGHGVMLRFEQEDRDSDSWSGYAFVSREGNDGKQPLLLVVR
jgi:hypothetical protein